MRRRQLKVNSIEIIKNYSLKELTTWRCGGRCSWFASPHSAEEAVDFLKTGAAIGEEVYALGGGSNVLIQDGELNAGVISCAKMESLKLSESNGFALAEVESGYSVRKLLGVAVDKNLGGLEFLAGIPGTVGGAVCGNAGADGVSFAPVVERIETVSQGGEVRLWETNELEWRYRSSPWGSSSPFLITRVYLRLPLSIKEEITKNIRHFSQLKKGQPIGAKTAGCVFKNPQGSFAGMLLDKCGCKGLSVGDAVVSSHHANFIENRGSASSYEIFNLAEMCRARVFDSFGIKLEYEIKFFGAF